MDVFKLQASLGLNTEEYERALKAAVSQAEALTRNMQQLTATSGSTDTSITETGKAAEDESKSVKEAAEQTKKLSDSLEKTGKNSDVAANKLKEASGKLKGDLAVAAKTGGAAFAATSALIIKSTKDAVDNFAQYEQLVGGAQLMFGDAYEDIAKKADNAYKTVQMSQIEYLEQVNGFATGLKTALGGNAEVAADLADKILTAEADVIAATGNSKEAAQNAFNGIMRSNYTMLDNLQLGIKPTKDGFQEVIDKVNEWNVANGKATKYQIDNLADAQNALVDYIEMQGLAGYASKEAADTIEGSAASAKAAWQNLLTGFGRDDADIDKLVDDVSESVKALGKNVIPVAERAFVSLSKTAMKEAVSLSKRIPDLADHAAEHIHQTIANEFGASADSIFAVEGAVKSAAAAFVTYKAAMVVSDAVEGVVALTNVIKGATTAQEALNAAGMANPYVLIATATAAAVTGIKHVIDVQADLIDVSEDTYNNLTDAQRAFIDSTNDLASGINNDISAAKNSVESVDKEVGALQNMTAELYAINDAEELTNTQKAKMQTLVDSLNKSLPDLNLQLDKETGHLKNQRGEVNALIESYSKQAKAQAAQNKLVKLNEDLYESDKKLKEALTEREKAQKNVTEAESRAAKARRELVEFEKTYDPAEHTQQEKARYDSLKESLEAAEADVTKYKNSLSEVSTETGRIAEANYALKDEINDLTETAIKGSVDLSKNMKENTDRTSNTVLEQSNVLRQAAAQFKDYVMVVNGETYNISQDTYDKIQELSDKYQEAINSQADSIRGSLDLFSEFNGGAETSSQELINNLWNNAAELDNWAENIASLADKGINQGLLNELEAAGPSSANKVKALTEMSDTELKNYSDKWAETQKRIHEIAEDQADDVLQATGSMIGQMIGLAKDNEGKAEAAYAELADYIARGAGEGISDGTGARVLPVTIDMVRQAQIAAEKEINDADFESKGRNIADGIAVGIEQGEEHITRAMTDIVNDAVLAYMEQTRSNSPSKLFRGLAEYIPQGMALGIEDGKDDVVNAVSGVISIAADNFKADTDLFSFDNKEKLLDFGYKSNKDDVFTKRKSDLFSEVTPASENQRSRSDKASYTRPLHIEIVTPDKRTLLSYFIDELNVLNGERLILSRRGAAL